MSYSLSLDGVNTNGTEILATLESGTYTSAYTPAHFSGSGNEYTFTPEIGKKTFTISGLGTGAKLETGNVEVSGNSITLSASALPTTHIAGDKISVSDKNYSLNLTASTVAEIKFVPNGKSVTLSGTTAGYKLINGESSGKRKLAAKNCSR